MEDYIVHIDFNGRDVIKVDAEDKEAAEKKAEKIFKRFADQAITDFTINEITAYDCEQIDSAEDKTNDGKVT